MAFDQRRQFLEVQVQHEEAVLEPMLYCAEAGVTDSSFVEAAYH